MGLVQAMDGQYKKIVGQRLGGEITTEEYELQMRAVDSDGDWVPDSHDPNIGSDDQEDLANAFADANEASLLNEDADWSVGGYNYDDQ